MMEVTAVRLLFFLIPLIHICSLIKVVGGIRICQSDCNSEARFSSFYVHCTRLFGLENFAVSATDSPPKTALQNSAIEGLLETCSDSGRLIVTKREKDVCVETGGFGMMKNISRFLLIGSKSYEVNLKTHVVRTFYFPWKVITCIAYMSTVKQFLIGFTNELATSSVNFRNKRTLRSGIFVNDIAVDEEENIIFLKTLFKRMEYCLHTMAQNGSIFKSLPIASLLPVKFDIDKKHKLLYVYKERKLTCYTYKGAKAKDVAQILLYMSAMVYDPTQGVLYFLQHQQLKMITKAGKESVVAIIKQFKAARFMEVHDNYLYIIARGVDDKVFIVHITDPLELKTIKVSKCRLYYRLCLF